MRSVKRKMKTSNKLLWVVLVVPFLMVLATLVFLRISFEKSPWKEGGKPDFGEKVSKVYDIKNFNRLVVMGPWNIQLDRGDEFKVEVGAQEKILNNLVSVKRTGSVLTLSYPSTYPGSNEADPMAAVIVLPSVSEVEIVGSCRVALKGFTAERLHITSKGAVRMSATDSKITNLEMEAEGNTQLDFSKAPVVNAKVNYTGTYTISLLLDRGRLSGVLGGTGTLFYAGEADISEMKRLSSMTRIVHRPELVIGKIF